MNLVENAVRRKLVRSTLCYGCAPLRPAVWRAANWSACDVCKTIISDERGVTGWQRITAWQNFRRTLGDHIHVFACRVAGPFWDGVDRRVIRK